jgi:hypothetical protein
LTAIEADSAMDVSPAGRSRQRRSARSERPAATGRRGRRARAGATEDVVASLTAMIEQLISENRRLKRDVARAERGAAGSSLGQASKALSGLQRRVSRALAEEPGSRGRGSAATSAGPRPRRKVTDPQVLQRRREALAKAREVRAAKRRATSES